ncbi:MAG: hypothetical protein O7D96_02770 [SAR324 cluster bacterium]|nr:hypothetical protein [SAR324 cluster bacterium]
MAGKDSTGLFPKIPSPGIPADRHAPAWRRQSRDVLAVLALLAALTAFGCGRSTAPRPASRILPPPAALTAHQRDGDIVVSWRLVQTFAVERFDRLRGFTVFAERLAYDCLHCPPLENWEVDLEPGDPALVVEGARAYHAFRPASPRAAWRFRAVNRFGEGTSARSRTVIVRGLNEIPVPEIDWDWSAAESADRAPARRRVRLFWEPRQEGVVRVIAAGAPPIERVRLYRVNVYRRTPGGIWPFSPLNPEPLARTSWVDAPFKSASSPEAVEYGVRWVDRFGGEGPLSAPARVALAVGSEP